MQVRSPGRSIRCFLLFSLITAVLPVQADFVFTAPPQYDEQTAREIFGPLIRYLELIIGDNVVFEYPSDWREYSNKMREDRYDIVFDAPHFSAWRMKHIDHEAVARLPGTLDYVIVTGQDEKYINSVRDLVSAPICSLVSPNLSTMTVYRLFENPVNMPLIQEIEGGFNDVYQALKDRQCKAAVLRKSDYQSLGAEEKTQFKIIAKSPPMPEQTITVSRRLRAKKNMISVMLTSVEGARAGENIFREFSAREQEFISVKPEEYQDLDSLLSNVVWGW